MSSRFFTNKNSNSLIEKFKGVFEYQDIHSFDILVGYFRASGYFNIRPFLENIPQIRILVGINVDSLIAEAKRKGQLYLENQNLTKKTFIKNIIKDISEANYDAKTEKGIIQFIEDIISKKVLIKAYGGKNLHAKIYIFRPNPFNVHNSGSVITGSSNLTDAGLGIGDHANYEFNVLLQQYDDVLFATEEFEELWNNSIELLPQDVQDVKDGTYLNEEISPYELYIKMLIEYFGDSVIQDNISCLNLPKGYTNLEYQADAVTEGFSMLKKHNGFILADVVGLGKTVIAIRIIKKYIDYNGFNTKILVVHPNAVEIGWKNTAKDFGLLNYIHFITNGSLHKIIDSQNNNYFDPQDYDLIVIDESHRFRTSTSTMYELLELICKTPRATIGADRNFKKKIMLLSATPLNNKPEDIANQIYLFQDSRKSTIEGVPNLQTFFSTKIDEYKKLKEVTDYQELVSKIKQIYGPIRDKIFKELVIRRTRADILQIPRYKKDIDKEKISFPSIKEPIKIEYAFNDHLTILFYETIDKIVNDINGLGYFRYRAIEFIDKKYRSLYENAILISRHLAGIVKAQMVKRLESSFYAFKKSLERFCISNQRMIDMFDNNKVYIAPDLNINKLYEEGREDEIEEIINEINLKSPNNAIYKKSDFSPEFYQGLIRDQKILTDLLLQWKHIQYDPKFKKFIDILDNTLLKKGNLENKLVVFSESKETVQYLSRELESYGRKDILAIDASNHKQKFNIIRKNFDANYTGKKENKYNIIITTEVLAEGINLHRSNVILNYDIPWNATRLMQRIGRVNRIGTKAESIYIYNFYPTDESNEQIKLNEKALRKLQGFHTAFSEDSKIYSDKEELINNTLGNLQPQDEVDERLIYLEKIRDLYKNNNKEYRRLKHLPLKSRVSRSAFIIDNITTNLFGKSLNNVSICYLRSNQKESFYIANESNCLELTFLEAVKLFRANKVEPSTTLKDNNHFKAIDLAIKDFRNNYSNTYNQDHIDTSNLSVQERNSILFLKSIINLERKHPEKLNPEFIRLTKATLKIIYMGVFRKLRKDIASLAAKQKKKRTPLESIIPALNKIYESYPIFSIAQIELLSENNTDIEQNYFQDPKIVLTETFS